MFVIKNFANDTICSSVNELKEKLVNNYNNCSVAIQHNSNNSNLTLIKFVCIRNGIVYNSYGDEKEFDFTIL